jgi:predicted regulator of Ras-like GTPase activity (Roadblock/LC7/MglB family)
LAIEVLKGNVEELMLTTKDYSICFFPVHENYFVALLVKKNGNVGKGRYLMKLMRPKIVEQL